MKKLYRILTLIIGIGVSGVLSGAELPFQKIREEAARLKRNSPEDYELGKKLAAEMKKWQQHARKSMPPHRLLWKQSPGKAA